jgi:parallel beta-helix repeat protein
LERYHDTARRKRCINGKQEVKEQLDTAVSNSERNKNIKSHNKSKNMEAKKRLVILLGIVFLTLVSINFSSAYTYNVTDCMDLNGGICSGNVSCSDYVTKITCEAQPCIWTDINEYKLLNDISYDYHSSSFCIRVPRRNLGFTIDCDSHSITGIDNTQGSAIKILESTIDAPIEIKNCYLSDVSIGIYGAGGGSPDLAGLYIHNNTIQDATIGMLSDGIFFDFEDNYVDAISNGIQQGVCNNTIIKNNVIENTNVSIFFENRVDIDVEKFGSENALIENNTITDVNYSLYLQGATRKSIIANNSIEGTINSYAIFMNEPSSHYVVNNLFYNNKFNTTYPFIAGKSFTNSTNWFNTTKIFGTNIIGGNYTGGNFYTDYAGNDSNGDGIGDIPFYIYGVASVYDELPLTNVLIVPANVYVNATYSMGNADGHTFGYDAFTTIQEGINAVASDGNVDVSAGSYTEGLIINKSITLQGEGSSSTTVTGQQTISASNVTIDGFTFSGTVIISDANNAINSGTLSNNTFTGTSYGIRIGYGASGFGISNIIVRNNQIIANTNKGILFYDAGDYSAQRVSYITVDKNVIANNSGTGISTYGTGYNTITNNNVSDNKGNGISIKYDNEDIVRGNIVRNNSAMGINIHQVTNSTIENNTVFDHINNEVVTTFWGGSIVAGKGSAIYIHEFSQGNIIRFNDLRDNKNGILISREGSSNNPFNNSINENKITGSSIYAILNALANPSAPENATRNWWGSSAFAIVQSNISANISFLPYYLDEEMTILSKDKINILDIAITPSPAYTTDTLNCSAIYSGIDGDTGSATIYWLNGTDLYSSTTKTGIASGSLVSDILVAGIHRGEAWNCTINATDGILDSLPNSTTITISNTAPAVQQPTITPTPAFKNSTLNCSTIYSDADGDAGTVQITWFNGSTQYSAITITSLTNGQMASFELTPNIQNNGEAWNCSANGTDGDLPSAPSSRTIVINNIVPSIDSLDLQPASPYVTDDLNCSYSITHPDAEPITVNMTFYDNTTNTILYVKQLSGIFIGSSILTGGNLTKHHDYLCEVEVADTSSSAMQNTTARTVSNSAPTGVIEIKTVNSAENPECYFTPYDADGDTLKVNITTAVDGTYYGSTETNASSGEKVTVQIAPQIAGANFSCTAFADDYDGGISPAYANSTIITSAVVTLTSPTASESLDKRNVNYQINADTNWNTTCSFLYFSSESGTWNTIGTNSTVGTAHSLNWEIPCSKAILKVKALCGSDYDENSNIQVQTYGEICCPDNDNGICTVTRSGATGLAIFTTDMAVVPELLLILAFIFIIAVIGYAVARAFHIFGDKVT